MEKYHEVQLEDAYGFFSKIPLKERDQYYENVFAAKQHESAPSKMFAKDYPSSGHFTYQNYQIYYHQLKASNSPKAIFIHFHGFRSHGGVSGYYADVIASRNAQVNVYALDQLNFGRSQGPCKGYIESLQDSASQGQVFIEHLLSSLESKPKIFLSGSSYGGSIIFKMAIRQPQKYSGLIFLGPALRDVKQSQCLKKFAKFLGWITPKIHLSSELSSKDITKFNCDKYIKEDTYYCESLVPGAVRAILNGMDELSELYGALSTPFLCFQGGMDKSVDLFAPIDLQNESPSRDKKTVYYKNMWHSIFYEEEIEDISNRVAEWVKQRT